MHKIGIFRQEGWPTIVVEKQGFKTISLELWGNVVVKE